MKYFSLVLGLVCCMVLSVSCQKTDLPASGDEPESVKAPVGDAAETASAEFGGWGTNYQESLDQAAREKKSVLLFFTGSTWCPPCIMMAEQTFSKPEFKEFAAGNLALVELDFPPNEMEATAQNRELAGKYQIQGFPTLILLNSEGMEIARNVGYLQGGPEGFIDWVNAAKAK